MGCLVRRHRCFACLYLTPLQAFQLVTYCWLFNPKAGAQWSQDDDMLGQMASLNGVESFPVDVLARGKFSDKYFDKSGMWRTLSKLTLSDQLG